MIGAGWAKRTAAKRICAESVSHYARGCLSFVTKRDAACQPNADANQAPSTVAMNAAREATHRTKQARTTGSARTSFRFGSVITLAVIRSAPVVAEQGEGPFDPAKPDAFHQAAIRW